MRAFALFLPALVLLLCSSASASIVPTEWKTSDGGNGHWYAQVITLGTARDWADSKAHAESLTFKGAIGHLVTITSAEEQLFIESIYDGNKSWIGLTDDAAFGGSESSLLPDPTVDGWVWVTGEAVTYTNWFNIGVPNGTGDYVTMGRGVKEGGWNDDFGHLERYIVEFEVNAVPEPSTIAIWAVVGVVGLGFGARR